MNTPTKNPSTSLYQSGFTLLEMAVVLMIVGLLMGGLLPLLSGQMEQQRRNETRKYMDEIRDALNGHAVVYGRLPCPTTTLDPNDVKYGVEDPASAITCTGPISDGFLPWKTLGVAETDAWGIRRNLAISPWTGYWRYRVDPAFASSVPFTLTTATSTSLLIQDNAGKALTSTSERPIAIFYSTGKNLVADGENGIVDTTYQSDTPRSDDKSTPVNEEFDDMMIWISRPQLFNRMVAAGKLP